MPVYSFEGKVPHIDPTAFVAPTATVVGDVTIEAEASVWYGAVVRGDFAPVVIRSGANIQDGAVLHAPPGSPCEIGRGATVAHNCVIHGAVIGDEALIANSAVVLDGATVGARSLVAGGALVKGGDTIPEGVLAVGSPAVVKGPLAGTSAEFWVKMNPETYRELARRHRDGIGLLD